MSIPNDPICLKPGNYVMFPAALLIPNHEAGMEFIPAVLADNSNRSFFLPLENNKKIEAHFDVITFLRPLPLTRKILESCGFVLLDDDLYTLEDTDSSRIYTVSVKKDRFIMSNIDLNVPILQNILSEFSGKMPEISAENLF